jgi:hypothetical protein
VAVQTCLVLVALERLVSRDRGDAGEGVAQLLVLTPQRPRVLEQLVRDPREILT